MITRDFKFFAFKYFAFYALLGLLGSHEAHAVYFDAKGHYSLLGETHVNPANQTNKGTFQGIRQSFRLELETKVNDKASFFSEVRIFKNPRAAFLGDTARPEYCAPRRQADGSWSENTDCEGRIQDEQNPGYTNLDPYLRTAYMEYGFDFCLMRAGRRPRDWGLGIYLNAGNDPFDSHGSVFDGIECNINVQKAQTLGFSVGYDKLQETGEPNNDPREHSELDPNGTEIATFDTERKGYGPTKNSDDMDQIFFTVELDDRHTKPDTAFRKRIALYFANIISPESSRGGATDLKFFDIFTGFYFSEFSYENELLFRLGKSSSPVWTLYGGQRGQGGVDDEAPRNNLNAIAIAGKLNWTYAKYGSAIGPAVYRKGDASSHSLFSEYAIAPGSEQAYYKDSIPYTDETGNELTMTELRNDSKATALRFNANYSPALIMFNGSSVTDDLINLGTFDPNALLNAWFVTLGYSYESLGYGNFTAKIIKASLQKTAPVEVKQYYLDNPDLIRPVGLESKDLGWELDLHYDYHLTYNSILNTAIGAVLPGDAWKIHADKNPAISYLFQAGITFEL